MNGFKIHNQDNIENGLKELNYKINKLNKNIMENSYMKDNGSDQVKKEKYFEIRLNGFRETLDNLRSVQQRLESMELSLTGTTVGMNKGEKLEDNEAIAKPSIMQELNKVNDRLNEVVYNMQDSLNHLEEIV